MKKSSVPILTVFILLMSVPPIEGQGGITRIFGRSLNITGYMTLGANWLDVQSLNTALEEYDYLLFSDMSGSWGGGSRLIIKKKFIIGFDYLNLFNKKETSGSYDTSVSGSLRMLCLGYSVYNRENVYICPIIGIGSQSLSLKLYENTTESFDSLLEDPKKGVDLSTRSLIFDVAVQFDKYSLAIKKSEAFNGD